MRLLTIAFIALLSQTVSAQQPRDITMSLDFSIGDSNGGASILTMLPLNRAWSDSVGAYFNDELRQKGPSNLVRAQTASADYKVVVQPLPMLADNKPVGIMIYSITMLRPPVVGTNWVYVNSSVGYTRSPAEAASQIRSFVEAVLRGH